MIYKIYSSLKSFKELSEFNKDLNILLSDKTSNSTDQQTRNRAGKTTVIEIINFLLGGDCPKNSIFRSSELKNEKFGMVFDLGNQIYSVERSGSSPNKVYIQNKEESISNKKWREILGDLVFSLKQISLESAGKYRPTFRLMMPYFLRNDREGGFLSPIKYGEKQQLYAQQLAITFILGLDWKIIQQWQFIRDQEKTLRELKKAAGEGFLGEIIGSVAGLRTQLAISEKQLAQIKDSTTNFKVLPQYNEYEKEVAKIKGIMSELSNQNILDRQMLEELEKSLLLEIPPKEEDLDNLFKEAGIVLPKSFIIRFDEVKEFHKSVVENRKSYLSVELQETKARIEKRDKEIYNLSQRKSEIMLILDSHGAIEELNGLHVEQTKIESETNLLKKRFEAAQKLEGEKNNLDIERKKLLSQLRLNYLEQKEIIGHAVVIFEELSKSLYKQAGSFTINESENGPQFGFPIQGKGSKGIDHMQIFCFDMTLMILASEKQIGPKFLIHDSHLFDGVDERQTGKALSLGFSLAKKYGFQYIVTMNSDDLPKNLLEFEYTQNILPTILTDEWETGGLLGLRIKSIKNDEDEGDEENNESELDEEE